MTSLVQRLASSRSAVSRQREVRLMPRTRSGWMVLAVILALITPSPVDAQSNECTANPSLSYQDPLDCTGACGSDCISREFENPPGQFHMACSCFSQSSPTCCHLIIKLSGSSGSPTGYGVKGSCTYCPAGLGRCKLDDQTGEGGDAQAVCQPGVLPH